MLLFMALHAYLNEIIMNEEIKDIYVQSKIILYLLYIETHSRRYTFIILRFVRIPIVSVDLGLNETWVKNRVINILLLMPLSYI